MRTINMQNLLEKYKIDVEYIKDFIGNDSVEIQETFYERGILLDNFDNMTLKEIKEFLAIEKELSEHLHSIKMNYPLLYEKIIEPQNEKLKTKLIHIFTDS